MSRRSTAGTSPGTPAVAGRNRYAAMDGYRGLFVLLVIAYHFGVTSLVGGWVGINHFFVFSGFLIARILIKEQFRTGGIRVVRFYLRRARRIIPAMMLLVAAVLVRICFAADVDRPQTAGDAVATLTFWLNWRLVARNDQYFDMFEAPSPLRHVWTLSVEEQFYVCVPWLLLALCWVTRRRYVRMAAVVALAVVSAVWSAHLVGQPDMTSSRLYYGTDVRMQALLVGIAGAVWHTRSRHDRPVSLSRNQAHALGWIGTLGSLVPFFVLDADPSRALRFGGMLLLGGLVTLMGVSALDTRPMLLNRIMSAPPLVHLGQISYGLYLFHWPVVLWLPLVDLPTPVAGAIQFLVTWVCAVLSYRLLEIPVMLHGIRGLVPWRGIRSVLGPGLVAAATGVALVMQHNLPAPAVAAGNGRPLDPSLRYVAPSPPLKVAVVGDSIPDSLIYGWPDGRYPGFDLRRFALAGGCDSIPTTLFLIDKAVPEAPRCPAWRRQWVHDARQQRVDVVLAPAGLGYVLPQVIDGRRQPITSPAVGHHLEQSLDAWLSQSKQAGARQLYVMNVPCRMIQATHMDAGARRKIGEKPILLRTGYVNGVIDRWVQRHRGDGARLLDLDHQLCANGYRQYVNGTLVFKEGVHFSKPGAALAWTYLAPSLVTQWRESGSPRRQG